MRQIFKQIESDVKISTIDDARISYNRIFLLLAKMINIAKISKYFNIFNGKRMQWLHLSSNNESCTEDEGGLRRTEGGGGNIVMEFAKNIPSYASSKFDSNNMIIFGPCRRTDV